MSPSPDPVAEHTAPLSNLTHLHHHHHRNASKTQDTPQPRGRNTSRHGLGRRGGRGERVTRIYPRDIANSPTTKPFSSTSPPGPSGYHATTSPLLSALGATRATAEWTKSLPFFANQASPANGGISIAGSPPTLHPSPGTRDAGFYAQQAVSNSPPASHMRTLSHPNQYTNFGGPTQHSPRQSPARDRRASAYSQSGPRSLSQPFVTNPPLPHQLQAHYYGLPNLDLGLDGASPGLQPGEGGYYCGFDTLAMAGDEAAQGSENVLLIGCQGGLDVFRVEQAKLDILGRLEGLRGGVLGAKILPWTSRADPFAASRPLIALTLHGPVIKDSRCSSGSGSSSVMDDSASDSPSRPSSIHGTDSANKVCGYQTTVEVYSLKDKERIAVLYKSPLLPLTGAVDSPLFQPPPPVGEFVIDAKGKFVVVASGASGEVFVFAPYMTGHADYPERFRCVGKIWTSVQMRERNIQSSASSAADGSEDVPPENYRVPVFSLSDRWLAVTPPGFSSLYPVNGTALTSPCYERPPGIAHHSVPPQPSPNCAVDAPEAAGLIDRITREGAQVAIKSAHWATKKGIQAFKSYMNKGSLVSGNNVPYAQDPMQHYFPPTHGHNQTQPRQEAAVISIYDLQKLLDSEEARNKNALQPIATIPAALGCSFLSFSPGGLMLMTVSKKGDYQDVWDLKRLNFRRPRRTGREQHVGPHVRQVARFSRMTITNVIDVVWSAPMIDKLAVITDKGTVHMFMMPSSAFQWPPPRRVRQASPPPAKPKEAETLTGRGGAVNSAMQAINGSAKPFLDAVRTRNATSGSRFSLGSFAMTPAAGAKSGKAVAAGVGKSINNMRHAGDNKLTLPISPSGVKPDTVRWLSGKGRGSVGLVSGGTLQIWRVQMRPATGKGNSANATSISKKKLAEFGLAPIYDSVLPPAIADQLFPMPDDPEPTQDFYGEWLPRSLPARKNLKASPAPLSFSEIETNPPYQPFYTDRRVTSFVFSRPSPQVHNSSSEYHQSVPELTSNLHHRNDDSPWLFGEDFDALRILSPIAHVLDEDDDLIAGVDARVENKLVLRDGEEEVEQVVVTTRRRRLKREEGEEGFFEDDCEVLDFAEDRV